MLLALEPSMYKPWPVPNWVVVVPVLTGFLAVLYMLPTPRRRPALVGVGLTVLALLGVEFYFQGAFGRRTSITVESALFGGFSLMSILFGMLMITQRNPARSAIYFTVVVLSVCGLFLLLAAPFLMAATIIIYAGAIIVTFLFVLMLSLQNGPSDANDRSREPLLSAALGYLVLATLLIGLQRVYDFSAVDSLIERSGRFAEADLLDDTLLNGNTREEFLTEARTQRDRLMIPRVGNGPNELERDPWQYIDSAIRTLDEPDSYRNLTPVSRRNPPEVRLALKQLRDGLVYLKNVRNGTATPPSPVVLSPYGQVRTIARAERAEPAPTAKKKDDDAAPPNPTGPPLNQLPSGNVAALGRVLFTDHLIAIELGGTLLLVATIGAILIAGTRREKTT